MFETFWYVIKSSGRPFGRYVLRCRVFNLFWKCGCIVSQKNYLKGYALCRWALLAPRAIWEAWRLHLGTLGNDFGTLGSTLGHRGSSRMVSRWSGIGLSSILVWFWNFLLKDILVLMIEISVSGSFPGRFLHRFSIWFFRRLGFLKLGFRIEGIANTNLSQKSFCY